MNWEVYTGWPFSEFEARRRQMETAKALDIPTTAIIDIGNGVFMDLVLIPAGTFLMGDPKPATPRDKPIFFGAIIVFGCMALGTVLVFIFTIAARTRRRVQYSLRCLLLMTFCGACIVFGAVKCRKCMDDWDSYKKAMEVFLSREHTEPSAQKVILTRPFFLGKFEVTRAQYTQVMIGNSNDSKAKTEPAEDVSVEDCSLFCRVLSLRIDRRIRLPSEAEWEFACRCGSASAYFNGDGVESLEKIGWVRIGAWGGGISSPSKTVGNSKCNAWGLFDMHGNVSEWALRYNPMSESEKARYHIKKSENYIVCGGSCVSDAFDCRSASRKSATSGYRNFQRGFRVAMDIDCVVAELKNCNASTP